jgi:hypothetical protein
MEKLLTPYVPALGLAVTLATCVYTASQWLNKSLDDDIELRVSLWLLGGITTTKSSITLNDLFNILFGKSLSIKRVAIVTILTVAISICAFFWFSRVYYAGIEFEYTRDDYIGFMILIFTKGSIAVYISYIVMELINKILLKKITVVRVSLFVVLSLVGIFMANVVIINAIDGLDILAYKKIWTGASAVAYDQFILNFNEVINFDDPIFVSWYLAPGVWIITVLAIFVISKCVSGTSFVVARVSPWISRDRIEKEPIALVGEAVAGIIFILIVLAGMLFPFGDNTQTHPSSTRRQNDLASSVPNRYYCRLGQDEDFMHIS